MKKSMFTGFSGALRERGISGAVRYAKSLGFDAVEPSPCDAIDTVAKAEELKRVLANEGMFTACFSLCVTLSGDEGKAVVERLKREADIARACGSPFLHHTLVAGLSPVPIGMPSFERVFDEVVTRAGEVADYCKTIGIKCLYEDQGFLFNGVERFSKFLDAMDHDNIGVCFDFGNIFFAGETPQRFIGAFSNRVMHVHIKDYLYKSGSMPHPGEGWLTTRDGDFLRDTIPGHGIVDFVPCFRILQKAGYKGVYSFEFGGPEPYELGTKRAMENMEYYYELARSTAQRKIDRINLPGVV